MTARQAAANLRHLDAVARSRHAAPYLRARCADQAVQARAAAALAFALHGVDTGLERCYKHPMIIKDAATAAEFVHAWKSEATAGRARRQIALALEAQRSIAALDRGRGVTDQGNLDAIAVLSGALCA